MSKNIVIQEGGIGKQLTVDKLKTNLVGGGSCLWVPEDSINLGTKHISENGTFRASDDGYLGYSEVTVSGVGTATGRDPTTGEEKRVSVDPETGDLEETIIPESIRITTLPTKVNYTNGETINYSGIVVHAYSSAGRDLGEVPFNELVFPVTQALASGEEWTDGQGLNAKMLYFTPHYGAYLNPSTLLPYNEYTNYLDSSLVGTYNGHTAAYNDSSNPSTRLITRYNNRNYMATIAGSRKIGLACNYEDELIGGRIYRGWLGVSSSTARAGDNAFEAVAAYDDIITGVPVSTVNPTTIDISTLHAIQTLPVQWPSADAGTTLETSFTINVTGGGT